MANNAANRRKPARPTKKPPAVMAHSRLGIVAKDDIHLVKKAGTIGRGGGPGGEAWSIETPEGKAGAVFINLIDELPIGRHASIQIFLNRRNQGRQIGRVGYRLASEQSQYDEIFAHMRKSNLASRRAAEWAGFVDVTPPDAPQLILKWIRQED